jgi:cytochrome c oxidase assembly protein subunit 15
MAVAALLAVVFQGVLGGLRVRLDARTFAMLHGCTGPLVFAYLAVLALVTSPKWKTAAAQALPGKTTWHLRRLSVAIVLLTYMQLVVGAQLRHTPIDAGTSFFRGALHFHLFLAAALLLHAVLLARWAIVARRLQPAVFWPAVAVVALVFGQVALGGATWVVKYGWPNWVGEYAFTEGYTVARQTLLAAAVVTAHVAIGSMILTLSSVTAACSFRYLQVAAHHRPSIHTPILLGVTA